MYMCVHKYDCVSQCRKKAKLASGIFLVFFFFFVKSFSRR